MIHRHGLLRSSSTCSPIGRILPSLVDGQLPALGHAPVGQLQVELDPVELSPVERLQVGAGAVDLTLVVVTLRVQPVLVGTSGVVAFRGAAIVEAPARGTGARR